jgi:predicted transcriptional regulator
MTNKLGIDNKCSQILTLLINHKEPIHFNGLYKELRKNKMELSKPTISMHLNHLIEKGFVERKEKEGTQFVYYNLNVKQIEKLKELEDSRKWLDKQARDGMNNFYALTEEQQIERLINIIVFNKLEEVKAEIELALDPDDFAKRFRYNFVSSPLFQFGQNWIVQKCAIDKAYHDKILKVISEWENVKFTRH